MKKSSKGITVESYSNDKARRLIQSDHNFQDSNNEDNWIEGTTVKVREYLQITLQSGDKLRVYNEFKDGKMQVQFSVKSRWSIIFNGGENLQDSKDIVLACYTKR